MKKHLALACLCLGLSLSACDSATGNDLQTTTTTTNAPSTTTALSTAESGLVGNWKCIRGIDENTAYFLALNLDRSFVVTKLYGTEPVTGARKLGTWKTAGDTLALTSTSTGQTYDGTTWNSIPYQQIQHMLWRVSHDTLKAILDLDTLVLVRTDATTPSIGTLSAPVFSLNSGTYSTSQVTTLSSASPGALLRCTQDGSTPSYRSPLCSDTIRLDSSRTIKAMATLPGMANSPVVTASYVIQPTTPRDTLSTAPDTIPAVPDTTPSIPDTTKGISDTVKTLAGALVGTWTNTDEDGNLTTLALLANGSAILTGQPEAYDGQTAGYKIKGLWVLEEDSLKLDISSILYSFDGTTWTSSKDTGLTTLGQVRVTANTLTFLDQDNTYEFTRQTTSAVAARAAQSLGVPWKRLQQLLAARR